MPHHSLKRQHRFCRLTLPLLLGLSLATISAPGLRAEASEPETARTQPPNHAGNLIFGIQQGWHIFLDDQLFSGSLLEDAPTYGLRLGYALFNFIDLELALSYVRTDAAAIDVDLFTYHGSVVGNLFANHFWTPYASVGLGGYTLDASIPDVSDTDFSLAYAAGLKWFFLRSVALRAEVRGLTLLSESETNFEFTLGLVGYIDLFKGKSDRDGDGIGDSADACPKEAEDRDGFEDEDGCPDLDNDGDGIADSNDKCPNDAEDLDTFEDADGCVDADNDADGIVDTKDKCPNQAEDKDGFADDDGCVDADNDEDGVADIADLCPNDAETINEFLDKDGCPDTGLQEFAGVIEGIKYSSSSSLIDVISYPVLNRAAEVLMERPEIQLTIEGHTDSTGSDALNKKLSQERAEAVRQYLISKGVGPDRLKVIAKGEAEPIADNRTAAGRARNRRIEFKLELPSKEQAETAPKKP